MKTEKDLSKRIEEINKLELTASIQIKKGRYYAVISYTNEDGKSEPKWRATGLNAGPGNKKAAKNKIPEIINKFKADLIKQVQQGNEKNVVPLEPEQLQIEYENLDSNVDNNVDERLDQQRINKYKNMSFLLFLKELQIILEL